jgi:hypothetical protein
LGAAQLEEHIGETPAVEQRPVGDMHVFVQLPQVWVRVRSVSQPSSGFAVQCPNPLEHPVG